MGKLFVMVFAPRHPPSLPFVGQSVHLPAIKILHHDNFRLRSNLYPRRCFARQDLKHNTRNAHKILYPIAKTAPSFVHNGCVPGPCSDDNFVVTTSIHSATHTNFIAGSLGFIIRINEPGDNTKPKKAKNNLDYRLRHNI
jgi:hypothetical protein